MRKPILIVKPSKSKTSPWMIDGLRVNGERKRPYFKTETAAKQELVRIKTKIAREGSEALNLSDSLRVMALKAERTLKPYEKTIADAVAFYVKHLEASKKSVTIRALADEYLAFQKSYNRSEAHQRDLRGRFNRFCLVFGDRLVHEITSIEIRKWLFDLKVAPKTFNNYRDRIGFLFGYGIAQGYLEKGKNPVDDRIKKMTEDDWPVEIFTVDEVSRILECASPEILPLFAIGAFAGVRTSELLQLEWNDVHFHTGHLDIRAGVAKSGRSRFFKLEPNLVEWLTPYAQETGRIWKGTEDMFRNVRKAMCGKAGITWVQNGLRHSFASYHIAKNQNQNQLADLLGHLDSRLIFSNYRAVVKIPGEADRYFALLPSAPVSNIVQMAQAS
jgi:integrase